MLESVECAPREEHMTILFENLYKDESRGKNMKKLLVSLFAVALLAGCGAGGETDEKTLVIGASTTPHAEILNHVKPILEKEGYNVTIKEFTDYVKPNKALLDGDLDANYFQHEPYLTEWAESAKASDKVTSVFAVHFEPLGIYSLTYTSLDDVNDGTTIAIPNDPTNGGRALQLLAEHDIITIREGKKIKASMADITKYNKKVKIIEMPAETCAVNIKDVDFAVINGNNALNARISDKLILTEDIETAGKQFGNIIAIRSEDKDSPKIKALIKALNTEDVKNFINEKYDGIVVPLVPAE